MLISDKLMKIHEEVVRLAVPTFQKKDEVLKEEFHRLFNGLRSATVGMLWIEGKLEIKPVPVGEAHFRVGI